MSTASSLSFYRTSPQESVSLDDFEELGRLRLKLLSRTCAEWSSHTRSKPPNPRMDEVVELREGTDADLLSHYALRLAFCRVTNDWSWFISAESKLFAVRLNNLPPESAVTLLSREGITFELLDRDNFKSVQSQKGIYRVPFTEALQLVNQREVVLHDGYCFVPCRRMNIVAIHHFERSLQDQMTDLQYALPAQGLELERLTPLLDALVKEAHVLSGSESLTTKLSAPQLDVIKIDQVADMHFPLCMKQLHRKLRENHHLKYDGRVQYRLFLKGAGMSVHECIQFFRSEFIKTIPASKFDKEYAYHIRHSYGLEGSRKDYKPLSCEQIISNNAPNHGQYHGCPFKHWDRQALQDEIYRCHVPVRTAMDILQQATSGNFQRACTSFFYATHHRTPLTRLPNCPDSDRTGIAPIMMHPNAYLNASLDTSI
ncbi:dna primase large subunit-like [Plasmopara halstedii]|uniref:Dna primase large subunit-like n=1 Tax=Plasmopara halstedii TaxID=4781 RepID=A0A0N7L636_PLAHL|nr:dna primase large subunit-like [Plasmopara halstedii]CEG43179.1 dna primase large subunit-like [Plasmopara halstedii]|eukprot:XP_024579548.1 dna primase large subunit-like [Plasmopara halstedii]